MSRANLSADKAHSLFGALTRAGVRLEPVQIDPGPWRLIGVVTRQETTASISLRRFGGETYLPICWRRERSGRVQGPAFPGYLFARIGLLTRELKYLRGVRGTVSFGDVAVDCNAIVAKIRSAEKHGLVEVKEMGPKGKCKSGDVIRITDGPFCGYPATITDVVEVEIDGSCQIEADVDIFGRPVPVRFEHHQFELLR